MKLVLAFFKLVRLPNLFFIALCQALFQFCIYIPLYKDAIPENDMMSFVFLLLASVSIAAAGYVINDYFDINIDEVNKPQQMVVDKFIHRRSAIAWHLILSFCGIVFTVLAVPVLQKWYLIMANIGCVALLWFYSASLKKSVLAGNVVIALLTAWTILILFFSKLSPGDAFGSDNPANYKFFRIAFMYAGFAFIISLIREAIKDMEDLPGDAKHGCRTMPVLWGITASKVYVAVWLIALVALLVIIQVYVLQFQWWGQIVYSAVLIIAPLVYIFITLFRASEPAAFHRLSRVTKFVMLTGILSMLFFRFYL
jgi:4-hydroxybenzoate polyprenyltransferase